MLLSSIAAACLMVSGCDQGARDLALDRNLARQSFVQFLETWKDGGRPGDLKEGDPAMIVGESTWEGGWSLTSYRLVDTKTDDGTNLHATAELVLRNPAGREVKSIKTYIVGTSPVITIFPK